MNSELNSYHDHKYQLFLRGKPQLHERMKRVPACHKKTPVDKNDKHPDFYEMSKVSPLPEVTWNKPTTQDGAQLQGVAGLATANLVGGGMLHANPNLNNPMSLLEGGASSSAAAIGGDTSGAQPPIDLTACTKRLEQENENLLLKIKLLEYEAQVRQQKVEAATKEEDNETKVVNTSNSGQV